jgi:hypothetical protein
LVHDITPCDDLPNFEGLLSSCVTEFPFAKRDLTIVEVVGTGIFENPVGTAQEVTPAAPLTQSEDGVSDPVKEINQKPPERKRRKLPEIPKIHQSKKQKKIDSIHSNFLSSLFLLTITQKIWISNELRH